MAFQSPCFRLTLAMALWVTPPLHGTPTGASSPPSSGATHASPQNTSTQAACWGGPTLSCLSGEPLLPRLPETFRPLPQVLALLRPPIHPRNWAGTLELGRGRHGYQFELKDRPNTRYRLMAKGPKGPIPIPGLKEGILFDVTDEAGRTRFIRMPKPVPDRRWSLCEIVGDGGFGAGDGGFGETFKVVEETCGMGLANQAVAIEVKDGPIHLGITDLRGDTPYVTTRVPEQLSLFLEGAGHQWDPAGALCFKASRYARRTGNGEKNLAVLEDLFRQLPPHEDGPKSLRCHLRAARARLLAGQNRLDLAREDLAHLLVCPNLPETSRELLGDLVTALAAHPEQADVAARLQAKAEALEPK